MAEKYDKFLELRHGEHSAHICRRVDRGEHEMNNFVLDASFEDINLLTRALAKVVDDPTKLEMQGEITEEDKERSLQLGESLVELLTRCYQSQHNHVWHSFTGGGAIASKTTDTAAALIATAFLAEAGDGMVPGPGDEDEDDDDGLSLSPGIRIIDTP